MCIRDSLQYSVYFTADYVICSCASRTHLARRSTMGRHNKWSRCKMRRTDKLTDVCIIKFDDEAIQLSPKSYANDGVGPGTNLVEKRLMLGKFG